MAERSGAGYGQGRGINLARPTEASFTAPIQGHNIGQLISIQSLEI